MLGLHSEFQTARAKGLGWTLSKVGKKVVIKKIILIRGWRESTCYTVMRFGSQHLHYKPGIPQIPITPNLREMSPFSGLFVCRHAT